MAQGVGFVKKTLLKVNLNIKHQVFRVVKFSLAWLELYKEIQPMRLDVSDVLTSIIRIRGLLKTQL